eukprot:gene69020-94579_t
MILWPHPLISAFIDMTNPANTRVIALAVSFLAFAALFQVFDGAQAVAAGMLRGLHDTKVPMIYAAIGYWGVGLPLGVLLAFHFGFHGVGIWMGLSTGLAVVAALLLTRWLRRDRIAPSLKIGHVLERRRAGRRIEAGMRDTIAINSFMPPGRGRARWMTCCSISNSGSSTQKALPSRLSS